MDLRQKHRHVHQMYGTQQGADGFLSAVTRDGSGAHILILAHFQATIPPDEYGARFVKVDDVLSPMSDLI